MREEYSKGEEYNGLPRDSLGRRSMQLHCVKTLNNSNYRHRRQVGKACSTPFSSICHSRNFRKRVLMIVTMMVLD
jgi:hypothetical protein